MACTIPSTCSGKKLHTAFTQKKKKASYSRGRESKQPTYVLLLALKLMVNHGMVLFFRVVCPRQLLLHTCIHSFVQDLSWRPPKGLLCLFYAVCPWTKNIRAFFFFSPRTRTNDHLKTHQNLTFFYSFILLDKGLMKNLITMIHIYRSKEPRIFCKESNRTS